MTASEGELDQEQRNRLIQKLHEDGVSQRAIATKLSISRPAVKKVLDSFLTE